MRQAARRRTTRSAAWGSRSTRVSKAREGPLGRRRPCSQLRSVATLTPQSSANCACVNPSFIRMAATSRSEALTRARALLPLECAIASSRPARIRLKAVVVMAAPFASPGAAGHGTGKHIRHWRSHGNPSPSYWPDCVGTTPSTAEGPLSTVSPRGWKPSSCSHILMHDA